jgi:hypothetical protein
MGCNVPLLDDRGPALLFKSEHVDNPLHWRPHGGNPGSWNSFLLAGKWPIEEYGHHKIATGQTKKVTSQGELMLPVRAELAVRFFKGAIWTNAFSLNR